MSPYYLGNATMYTFTTTLLHIHLITYGPFSNPSGTLLPNVTNEVMFSLCVSHCEDGRCIDSCFWLGGGTKIGSTPLPWGSNVREREREKERQMENDTKCEREKFILH